MCLQLNNKIYSNQEFFEIPTVSAHERRQRKLSEKFTLRPASIVDSNSQLKPLSESPVSPNYSTESIATTTDTSSQLNHIVQCLSLQVPRMDEAETSALSSDADGSLKAFYFPQDSPPAVDHDDGTSAEAARMSTNMRRASCKSANIGEAIELAQMHERFMLHEERSADVLKTILGSDDMLGTTEPEKTLSLNRQRSLIDSMFKKPDLPDRFHSAHSFDVDSIDALNTSLHSLHKPESVASNAKKISKHKQQIPELSMSKSDVDNLAKAIVSKVQLEKKMRASKSPPSSSSARIPNDAVVKTSRHNPSPHHDVQKQWTTRSSPRPRCHEFETTLEFEASIRTLQKCAPSSTTTLDSYCSAVHSLPSSPRLQQKQQQQRKRSQATDPLLNLPDHLIACTPQTFDTSQMPPPPPFNRKRVCGPMTATAHTINLNVMASRQATSERCVAGTNAKISANCVIRRA